MIVFGEHIPQSGYSLHDFFLTPALHGNVSVYNGTSKDFRPSALFILQKKGELLEHANMLEITTVVV